MAQQTHEWYLKVGSWNLLNFSMAKATFDDGTERAHLLRRMGDIAGNYDIIVFQEVLQTGASVTQHLANYLPANYVCNRMSAASGRAGRQERYVICAPPANQWGAIAIAALTDYSTTGVNYLAANGTNQPAANVWMRPPVVARVTFTPNDNYFHPVVFDIYTIHTKPAYGRSASARPAGTVANAPNNSVVHYELRAVEQNLGAGANRMLIGDLNADCAFYSPQYRGQDFAAWSWHVNYGQRTTTAVGSSCGYDKIILNAGLNAYRRATGVNYPNYSNVTRVDGRRLSDHYPVWIELFQQVTTKKRTLVAAMTLPVSTANKQQKFITDDPVNIKGSSLAQSKASALLWVTAATTSRSYKSNFTYPLTDVRGEASPAPTDGNGDFIQTVTWQNPPTGAYTFVFDANGDGSFNKRDGDFANEDVEADIYVTSGAEGHNNLVTLGDNMVSRDVFSLAQAKNVYVVGRNLPVNFTGTAYIVSWKRLRASGYNDWSAARAAQVDLASISIPIQRAGEGMINTSTLTAADARQPFVTNPRGELFMSIWSKPAQLMNATVNYRTPPVADFSPGQAGDGDPPNDPNDTNFDDDPCSKAYYLGDPKLKSVCAFGFRFSDYYGTEFAVVLDVDGDGKLGLADPIDLRDIGDMTAYFAGPGAPVLGPGASGNSAVSEYKEYLSRALSVDLSSDNIYDQTTIAASTRYACGGLLSKAAFQKWIVPDAATGFRVLDETAYQEQRTPTSGLYQYDDAYFEGADFYNADVCLGGNNISYSGTVTASQGSNVTSVASVHRLDGATITGNGASLCFASVNATAGAALYVGAGTSFFTVGGSWLAGLAAAALIEVGGTIGCGLAAIGD